MNQSEKVTEYINNTSPEHIQILKTLRQLIHKTVPKTTEDLKWGIPVFTKSKIFTYLRCSKNHIALGLYNIDRINDKEKLLEGTGKTMKHLKIKKLEDIDSQLIVDWLKKTAD
jgi:hypothetical protein